MGRVMDDTTNLLTAKPFTTKSGQSQLLSWHRAMACPKLFYCHKQVFPGPRPK